jgi:hypothetical protein
MGRGLLELENWNFLSGEQRAYTNVKKLSYKENEGMLKRVQYCINKETGLVIK